MPGIRNAVLLPLYMPVNIISIVPAACKLIKYYGYDSGIEEANKEMHVRKKDKENLLQHNNVTLFHDCERDKCSWPEGHDKVRLTY